MEKQELRAVIKYLHKKGMTPKEIHEDMVSTLGKECLAYSTVRKWVAEFKQGRTSTEDDPRSGCPKTSSSDEQVDAIHCMVLSDRRMTVQQIAKATDISVGSVHHVLTDILGMNKLSARWVPRMLTPEQMLKRVDISRTLLTRFHADPENFQRRIVTQDETWVHHFEPESKLQSKEWKHHGSPPPKKFKRVASVGKVMASVFWDCEGVLMVDYLQKGQTINGEFYASELRKLKKEIKAKRRGKLRAGVLLLQDNAPVHTAQVAVAEAHNCGFELLPHPPYSPDLAPSDFYLQNSKEALHWFSVALVLEVAQPIGAHLGHKHLK
ncbi:histone-lysine N-methyltransferase SETMAR-like [Sphaeramia orbicularis]|uniref:histone-lysine N-methyltransferase SETMAR-like n=1 Tax=Sphaeramia orbicularis TaxID=375764 RepID=UPI00117E3A61|nr:histone-lysine N-methyltransferase SETMAR-like [Sphaeramia orbicularis]